MQMIFQDPYASLHPRMKIGKLIGEPLWIHGEKNRSTIDEKVLEIAELVGLRKEALNKYPHEFSGGQRQRIAIARALMLNPAFIVCDEPVSALDASIQSQIINLMLDLQERFQLTYLFISHDLHVVQYICSHVAVMYMGNIVEQAPVRELFENPEHPYTITLLDAIPTVSKRKPQEPLSNGELEERELPQKGCLFYPRCKQAQLECQTNRPPLKEIEADHFLACFVKGGRHE